MTVHTSKIKPTTSENQVLVESENLVFQNPSTGVESIRIQTYDANTTSPWKSGYMELYNAGFTCRGDFDQGGGVVRISPTQLSIRPDFGNLGSEVFNVNSQHGEVKFNDLNSASNVRINTNESQRVGIEIVDYGMDKMPNSPAQDRPRSIRIRTEDNSRECDISRGGMVMTRNQGGAGMFTIRFESADSNGSLGINGPGTTTSHFRFTPSGDAFAEGSWDDGSDVILKRDIESLLDGVSGDFFINRIKALRPVSYTRIISDTPEVGLVANEVANVIPQAVTEIGDDPESGAVAHKGIKYAAVTANMIAAMKQLIAKVEELEAQVAALS